MFFHFHFQAPSYSGDWSHEGPCSVNILVVEECHISTTRSVFYVDNYLDMHCYAVKFMWAYKTMTSCEAVLYVEDVQWTYNNDACWQFGPVKLLDS